MNCKDGLVGRPKFEWPLRDGGRRSSSSSVGHHLWQRQQPPLLSFILVKFCLLQNYLSQQIAIFGGWHIYCSFILSRPPPLAQTTTRPVTFFLSDIFSCRSFLA